MLEVPDFSNFIIYNFFDISIIGSVYFTPTFFHKALKHQGGNAKTYIVLNLILGWTVIFWFLSLYKAFFK